MFTLNCKGRLVTLHQPLVMGIINATPDSFHAASRATTGDEALRMAEKMVREGADILDIGGQSTRPGAERLGINEELKRVLPTISAIHARFPETILSIDTFFSPVASEAIAAGASIINDISGGRADAGMMPLAAKLKVPFICMHIKGNIETMHKKQSYQNFLVELLDFFIERRQACLSAGVTDFIADPGFGFSKSTAENFSLLKNLNMFSILDCPVLVGVSRKSTIYKTLGIGSDEALNGTTVLNTVAMMNGASILRVHDVKEAKEAVKLIAAIKEGADIE